MAKTSAALSPLKTPYFSGVEPTTNNEPQFVHQSARRDWVSAILPLIPMSVPQRELSLRGSFISPSGSLLLDYEVER